MARCGAVGFRSLLVVLAGAGAAQALEDRVDLFLSPPTVEVEVGQIFEIGLIARSQTSQEVPMAALSAVLDWDPTKLALLGVRNNGPYRWYASRFSTDYDLNDTFADGDAYYEALSQLLPPAIPAKAPGVSTNGLLVTTLRIRALALSPGTQFAIAPESDPPNPLTITQVVHGTIPALDVTGSVGSATIRIVPEPATIMLVTIASIALLGRRCAGRREPFA